MPTDVCVMTAAIFTRRRRRHNTYGTIPRVTVRRVSALSPPYVLMCYVEFVRWLLRDAYGTWLGRCVGVGFNWTIDVGWM